MKKLLAVLVVAVLCATFAQHVDAKRFGVKAGVKKVTYPLEQSRIFFSGLGVEKCRYITEHLVKSTAI